MRSYMSQKVLDEYKSRTRGRVVASEEEFDRVIVESRRKKGERVGERFKEDAKVVLKPSPQKSLFEDLA